MSSGVSFSPVACELPILLLCRHLLRCTSKHIKSYSGPYPPISMTPTRDFKELVKARLDRDPKARQALLREAVQSMLEGDVDTGKPCSVITAMQRSASRSLARQHVHAVFPPRQHRK